MAQEKMHDRIITIIITLIIAGILGVVGTALTGGALIKALGGVPKGGLKEEVTAVFKDPDIRQAVRREIGPIPVGAVVGFHKASCPDGWKDAEYAKGRFIIGVGETSGLTPRSLLQKGGEEQHLLTIAEMPNHNHQAKAEVINKGIGFKPGPGTWKGGGRNSNDRVGRGEDIFVKVKIEPNGGNKPHNNMPPYVALLFCEKK